jgi:hypothetical protein
MAGRPRQSPPLGERRPPTPLMHIEYQVSEDDFESAAWLALRKRAIPGAFQFYYGLAFTALWVFLCMMPVIANPTIRNFTKCLLFASFGLAILSCRLLFTRFKFRRQYRNSPLSHLRTTSISTRWAPTSARRNRTRVRVGSCTQDMARAAQPSYSLPEVVGSSSPSPNEN